MQDFSHAPAARVRIPQQKLHARAAHAFRAMNFQIPLTSAQKKLSMMRLDARFHLISESRAASLRSDKAASDAFRVSDATALRSQAAKD
jgi:hypothetical protein